MKTDFKGVLLARNRHKKQHKAYMYEAQIDLLKGIGGNTASENVFALVSMLLKKLGKQQDFLTEKDTLIINNLRRAISDKI
jgi:hypothetical protein